MVMHVQAEQPGPCCWPRTKSWGNRRVDLPNGRIEDAAVKFYDVLGDATASMGPIEREYSSFFMDLSKLPFEI